MRTEMFMELAAIVLGSQALFEFIKWAVDKKDSGKGIAGRLDKLEKDGLRTQMLVLISLKPQEKKEIMTLGEHYFKVLHGDWYMTDIFNKWLEAEGHSKPEWFDADK